MTPETGLVLLLSFALLSAAASYGVIFWSGRRPPPKQTRRRKRQTAPTIPEIGGLAIIPVLCAGWVLAVAFGGAPAQAIMVAAVAIALATISWYDQRRNIPRLYCLTAQAAAVVIGLILLPGAGHLVWGILPITADLIVTTGCWIGAMSLVPRMDQADGLTAMLCVSIGIGTVFVGFLGGSPSLQMESVGVVTVATALGYLAWSRPPARLRLGAVGTVPLAYMMTWLVLGIAGQGHWTAALILSFPCLGEVVRLVRSWVETRSMSGVAETADARAIKKPNAPRPLHRTAVALGIFSILAGLAVVRPWSALALALLSIALLSRKLPLALPFALKRSA